MIVTVVVAAYLLSITVLGYYGYTKTGDEADFLVAGRDIGVLVGAGTLFASQISASTVLGAVGVHYIYGIGFVWIWLGVLVGWVVAFTFIAPQLRRFGGMTVPDFIGARYADDGAGGEYARAVSALLISVVLVIFLTAQYTAGSLVLAELFGLSEAVGIWLMVVVAVSYTGVGGMRASVLTDFFQSLVLLGGSVLAAALAVVEVGGPGAFLTRAGDPSLIEQQLALSDLGGFVLASVFGLAVSPQIIARFYTMRDVGTLRSAIKISLGAQAVIAVTVATLGLSAQILFPALSTPDAAVIVLSQNILGTALGTVFILALLSAILSTIDSVLLVASSGIAHDIYGQLWHKDAPERRKLWVNRVAVVAVGVIPGLLSVYREAFGGLITLIALLNLSLQGAMLFVPLVLGLHWQRATTAGGIGSMITGFGTAIGWHLGTDVLGVVPRHLTRVVGDPVVPGLLVSLATLVVLSLLTATPSPRATDPFFADEP